MTDNDSPSLFYHPVVKSWGIKYGNSTHHWEAISDDEARTAIQLMGGVLELLLISKGVRDAKPAE